MRRAISRAWSWTVSSNKREDVLRAARSVFATRGYSGASTRIIAAEAGVTAMALYNYAPSKAALFELVWKESVEGLYAGFDKAIVGTMSLVDELNAVFDHLYVALPQDPDGVLFTSRLLVERTHPDLAHLDLHTAPYAEFFSRLTERAVKRRELKRSELATFVAFVTTLLWGVFAIATLDPAVLGISVDAAKASVARFLQRD